VSGSAACWVSLTGKPIFIDDVFTGFRGVASDVTQARLADERIAQLAYFDELTGLPNRANLLSQLETWVAAPLAEGAGRTALCLDLDTFKVINDTLGAHAADQILRQVTNRLTEHALPTDIVARVSSDGFVMMIERPAGGELEAFLDTLASYLAEPYSVLGASIVCTASIGAAPADDRNLDAVHFLKRADLAMHEARRKGKGRWASFSQEIAGRADARLRGETDLRRAMERGELYLVYQPQISAQTQKVVGFEALVRWDHPELGSIPPSEFVPIAEETGQIVQIGEWIIRTAFAEAAKLPRRIKMSVNISPLQMSSDNLIPCIVNALAANRLTPSRIELEITESVLISDTTFALQRMRQLRELGLRVSLDDFGTGYSSLSYLRAFPFDKIKIDQSFVRDLETDKGCRAIVQATLSLAKLMGMRCTAEGVETLCQASFLKEHGCDDLQGYLAGRPQPMKNFAYLLEPVCPATDHGCRLSAQEPGAAQPLPQAARSV
jgi:diguanylate cyclase (GGDEF)-like protein